MYQGNDRVRQVNAVKEIAGDIRSGAAGEGAPEELVEHYLNHTDLPNWFDDHDRDLLLQFVKD